MPDRAPELGVVVVTYSPGHHLDTFLDTLDKATTRALGVVLADNGSDRRRARAGGRAAGRHAAAHRVQPRLRPGRQPRRPAGAGRLGGDRQPRPDLGARRARHAAGGGRAVAVGRRARPGDPVRRTARSTRRPGSCPRSAAASGTRCAAGGGRPTRGPRRTGVSAGCRPSGWPAGCPGPACSSGGRRSTRSAASTRRTSCTSRTSTSASGSAGPAGRTCTCRPRWSATRAGRRPRRTRARWPTRTTPAPGATCPAGTPGRAGCRSRVVLRAGLAARAALARRVPAVAAGARPAPDAGPKPAR